MLDQYKKPFAPTRQLTQNGARNCTGEKSICQNGAVPLPWHSAVYVQISSPSSCRSRAVVSSYRHHSGHQMSTAPYRVPHSDLEVTVCSVPVVLNSGQEYSYGFGWRLGEHLGCQQRL